MYYHGQLIIYSLLFLLDFHNQNKQLLRQVGKNMSANQNVKMTCFFFFFMCVWVFLRVSWERKIFNVKQTSNAEMVSKKAS